MTTAAKNAKASISVPTGEEETLVSFVLLAYNQEKYIREAIEGAFSQTYRPLEIILSDDCSPDNTFKIMEEMSARYKGPHIIRLNRNSSNFGIGAHINQAMSLTSGRLIVIAAGDDISTQDRVGSIYEKWVENAYNNKLIYSDSYLINMQGEKIEDYKAGDELTKKNIEEVVAKNLCASGATCAIDRDVFFKFGPLSKRLRHEDRAWATRAAILGKIVYVDKPLVHYRIEGGVSREILTKFDWISSKSIPWYKHFINDYQQKINDIQCASNFENSINVEKLLTICKIKKEEMMLKLELASDQMDFTSIFNGKSLAGSVFRFKIFIKFLKKKLNFKMY